MYEKEVIKVHHLQIQRVIQARNTKSYTGKQISQENMNKYN